jgi:hypothetical protein
VIADQAETTEISPAMQWFVVAARSSATMNAGKVDSRYNSCLLLRAGSGLECNDTPRGRTISAVRTI